MDTANDSVQSPGFEWIDNPRSPVWDLLKDVEEMLGQGIEAHRTGNFPMTDHFAFNFPEIWLSDDHGTGDGPAYLGGFTDEATLQFTHNGKLYGITIMELGEATTTNEEGDS